MKNSSPMTIKHMLAGLFILASITIGIGQDKVLFEVADQPVYLSEFKYIYEKNNRDNADYTKESLEEYLDLYINFKLKVQKAKDEGYDLSEQYKEELAGYRRQLADSYVIDKEVIDRIAEELYQRQQYDIKLSHILSNLPPRATPERKQKELEESLRAKKAIQDGLTFEEAVERFSEDPNSVPYGGSIGFITSPLPEDYLQLEDAAYELAQGQISDPVYTSLGWHIVRVDDKRPARGTIEIAHILMKKERNGIRLAAVDAKIKALRDKIIAGEISFEDAARRNSDDRRTQAEGGYLGFAGISEYELPFEDAAFALTEDGQISEPVETSLGWHIIKRISKRELPDKKTLRARIKSQMNTGLRFERTKEEVVENLKKEAGFTENMKAVQIFIDSLDDSFFQYNWKQPNLTKIEVQSYGPDKYHLEDLATYAKEVGKLRLKNKGQKTVEETALEIYKKFTADNAIGYAESRLEERYDDFKNLMREYEEGILLFEITKDNVWDKAAKDTTGLKKYYEEHKGDYTWKQRARLVNYSLRSNQPNRVAGILNDARKMTPEELVQKYNTPEKELVMYTEDVVEVGSDMLEGMVLSKGAISNPNINNGLKMSTFKEIEEVIPPGPKSLKEAKGYIISDYQDVLEKEWIQSLRSEYDVSINKKTLKSLIK